MSLVTVISAIHSSSHNSQLINLNSLNLIHQGSNGIMDLTIAQMATNEKEMARKQSELQANRDRIQKVETMVMKDRAEDLDSMT